MKNTEQNIVESMNRILNIAIAKENVPRMIDSDVLLYRAEIHLIDAVGSHPEANLTELSEILGVTKGAVSQKVKILQKKHYIKRFISKSNSKEIFFELTEKGKEIFMNHKEFHKQLNRKILKTIKDFDESDIEKLGKIFQIIEEHLETL